MTRIVAGDGYTLALTAAGRVMAWGENDRGQLGDRTRTNRLTPVAVRGVGGSGTLHAIAIAIAAGRRHSLAIQPNGTVVAWGDNFNGQLGDGTTMDRLTPVRTKGLGGKGFLRATAVAAGQHHSLAIRPNGMLAAWGRNFYGQLGDTSTNNRPVPGFVSGLGGTGRLTHVVAIDAGVEYRVALLENRTVATWGYNFFGQLGDGTVTVPGRPRPALVNGPGGADRLTVVVAVAAGFDHTAAALGGGRVATWGGNAKGQLGDGSPTDRPVPGLVRGFGGGGRLDGIDVLVAGSAHTIARIAADGGVAAWGDHTAGQLGDGSTTDRLAPVRVRR